MYKGQLEGFPKPIVGRMLLRQEEAGNPRDVTVFEKIRFADIPSGGFTWNNTPEGWSFWDNVINKRKFDVYFNEYPEEKEEKPIIKTSVHDLTDKEVIHCTTKEESNAIRELLHKEGFTWRTGESYLVEDTWGIASYPDIAYHVKLGEYCSSAYYSERDFTLYPASNFLNKEDDLNKKDGVLDKSSKELKCIDPPKDIKVVWLRTKKTIEHERITLPKRYITWETAEDYFNLKGTTTCLIEKDRFRVNWSRKDFEVIPDPRVDVKIPDLPKLDTTDRNKWIWGYSIDDVYNVPNVQIPEQMFDYPVRPEECYLSEFIQPQEVKTILKRKSKTIKL